MIGTNIVRITTGRAKFIITEDNLQTMNENITTPFTLTNSSVSEIEYFNTNHAELKLACLCYTICFLALKYH
jgi:hypothetical protein